MSCEADLSPAFLVLSVVFYGASLAAVAVWSAWFGEARARRDLKRGLD